MNDEILSASEMDKIILILNETLETIKGLLK